MRKAGGLQAGPIMPGGGNYMLVANIDESIVNCLTWDLFRKRMLSHFFLVSPCDLLQLTSDLLPEVEFGHDRVNRRSMCACS